MIRCTLVTLCAIAFTCGGCSVARFEHQRVEKQTIKVQSADDSGEVPVLAMIDLTTFNGAIDVRPHAAATVAMEVRYKAYGATPEEAQRNCERLSCDYEADGDVLVIKAVKPAGLMSAAVAFSLSVPESCSLKLKTSNGAIKVEQLTGSLSAETSNGSIDLQNVGDVVARSSNGALNIQGAIGKVDAKTSNGKIIYSGLLVGNENQLRTSNGRIEVELSPEQVVDVEGSTSNGRVACTIPDQKVLEESKRSLHTVTGSGTNVEARLRLSTSNGQITIAPWDPASADAT